MQLLGTDGHLPVKELAERLNVTPPTIYSRLKHLIGSGILKITGTVDIFKIGQYQSALIAITISDESKLASTLDALAELEEVQWSVAVTGRYDIFAEVLLEGSMEALFAFHAEKLARLDGVGSSESFVIMKTNNKWFSLARTRKMAT